MKKQVIVGRFIPSGETATRQTVLPGVRYADGSMLGRPRQVLTVERPVRLLKRLARSRSYGLRAVNLALAQAGIWPERRVTTERQLEVVLQGLPKRRLERVVWEVLHG